MNNKEKLKKLSFGENLLFGFPSGYKIVDSSKNSDFDIYDNCKIMDTLFLISFLLLFFFKGIPPFFILLMLAGSLIRILFTLYYNTDDDEKIRNIYNKLRDHSNEFNRHGTILHRDNTYEKLLNFNLLDSLKIIGNFSLMIVTFMIHISRSWKRYNDNISIITGDFLKRIRK